MPEEKGHIELERQVDSIIVGVRHRQHPEEGIEPLMASIKKLGLLQPVTITPDGVLVCGARRLEAVKRLGWRTLKVWVRSGISDELNRLLAQNDENEQRKPLSPLEQAALFRELKELMREDGKRRQEASRFGADSESDEEDGAAAAAAPRGEGDTRRQAAQAVTGKASYNMLEQISAIERVAADRSLPDTVRKIAESALEDIQNGGDVKPAYFTVQAARELIGVDDSPMPPGPITSEELEDLANEALNRIDKKGRKGKKKPSTSGRSLRAFRLTWGDLDGWSRFYNPTELAVQLNDDDWAMFERVVAETNAFADEIRALRSSPISA
ncbi:ParB/RepB/Spo0J family partition protein [Nocardioides sp.]|uniref:ParB/RepB/Spo0J family partition protein n=1 Tax=Nocardioides sp. TaxID=35761 RepID=UPI003D0C811E